VSGEGVANVYLGTSEFAARVLEIVAASPHRPRLVVTPPDRRRGRGRKEGSPPVAVLARELGIELHQTPSVNAPESVEAVRSAGAEVGCVCAFGQLIAEPLLSELPMLNVHPSLLPRWRGAAPIERAIMAGDAETGVCVMRLTEGLDSGPVALRTATPIAPGENYEGLAARLAELGGELLVAALDRRLEGKLEFEPQSEDGVTYAEKIGPEDRRLDPARPAIELERTVRALTPHVGAFLELDDGERLGIRAARAVSGGPAAGTIEIADGALLLGCGEGALELAEVQPPGKRAMAASEYLRGNEPPSAARMAAA
jgi:methionyl-tRNA formyltransferase